MGMDSTQCVSKGIICLASKDQLRILPLYEHSETLYQRKNESEHFEFCGRKTLCYTFGHLPKIYKSVFTAVSVITNIDGSGHDYKINQDKDLDKIFIGQVVEESILIERNELLKRHTEKRSWHYFKGS